MQKFGTKYSLIIAKFRIYDTNYLLIIKFIAYSEFTKYYIRSPNRTISNDLRQILLLQNQRIKKKMTKYFTLGEMQALYTYNNFYFYVIRPNTIF